MQAAADQPQPGGGDDESSTRLEAGRLAQVEATSETGEDAQGAAHQQVSAPAQAVMSTAKHQAPRNEPGDEGNAEDQPLPASPQVTGRPQQVAPIRGRVTQGTQGARSNRLDDHEARPGGDQPRHPQPDTPDNGD
jgi:hypothetical protein